VTTNLAAHLGNEAGRSGGTDAPAQLLVDSTPYPWPWDGRFDPRRCALLIIEATEPALPIDSAEWAVIGELADQVSRTGGLVVSVHSARPPRFNGPGSAPVLTTAATGAARFGAAVAVTAPGWDAFFDSPLDTVLRQAGRDLLLLAGGWLEVGVHSTMRSANDRGYECLLIPSACIAINEVTRVATISSTEMSGGIFGAVAGPSGTSTLFTDPAGSD
jgi:nicotinamidase-related amidase